MSSNPEAASPDVGDLLLAQGKLTPQQLEQVRRRQRRLNLPQHRAIVDLNFASEEDTWRALAAARHLEFADPVALDLKRETLELVPIKLLFHYHLLPLGLEEDCVTLAFSEPPSQMEQGNLRLLLSKRFKIVLATPSSIHAVIKKNFGLGAETIQKLREDRGGGEIGEEIVFDVQGKEPDSALEATVSAFVDQILQEALRLHATDIHLEPYAQAIRLRYRVDGILETVPLPTDMRHLHPAVVSRLKIMAGLNIAEKRLPHDGRIAMKTGNEEYDLRVSIVPTRYGEAVCLRILGRQSLYLDLGQLGMEPGQEAVLNQLTRLPQGMILLTGPTGSGKTTTLYTLLQRIATGREKVVSVEDPVEYAIERVTQVQVQEKGGLTFARALRSILRQDPDVILVGEMRDLETAGICVQAALTGHLVLSTLHTNDAPSALTRLVELGVPDYLVTSTVQSVLAQRLVRKVCMDCAEVTQAGPVAERAMASSGLRIEFVLRGRGCPRCRGTGYRGRSGLYELLEMDDEIRETLMDAPDAVTIRRVAEKRGMRALRDDGWRQVAEGVTTPEEVLRVTAL